MNLTALGAHSDISPPCFQVQETIMNLHRTIVKMYQTNTSRYYHFKKKQALLTEARKWIQSTLQMGLPVLLGHAHKWQKERRVQTKPSRAGEAARLKLPTTLRSEQHQRPVIVFNQPTHTTTQPEITVSQKTQELCSSWVLNVRSCGLPWTPSWLQLLICPIRISSRKGWKTT